MEYKGIFALCFVWKVATVITHFEWISQVSWPGKVHQMTHHVFQLILNFECSTKVCQLIQNIKIQDQRSLRRWLTPYPLSGRGKAQGDHKRQSTYWEVLCDLKSQATVPCFPFPVAVHPFIRFGKSVITIWNSCQLPLAPFAPMATKMVLTAIHWRQ